MYIYNIRVEVGHTYLYAWYTGRNQQKRDPGQKRMRYSIDTPIVVRKSSRLLSSVAAAPDIATSTFSISNTHVSELCVCVRACVCVRSRIHFHLQWSQSGMMQPYKPHLIIGYLEDYYLCVFNS